MAEDILVIKAVGFGDDLEIGALDSNQFTLGSSATKDPHRFIYDQQQLFFDIDGAKNLEAISLATP
ncbi:MAG: hypothetical protein AB4062_21555 [Crocosphaera sp.]